MRPRRRGRAESRRSALFAVEEAHDNLSAAKLTLRSMAAFLQNENARSPEAKSSWRRPAPNHRSEGHALAHERRSKPLGRYERWTRHASKYGRRWRYQTTSSKASLDGWGRVVTHAQRTPTRERRQVIPPDVSGQRWVTTFPSLDAFALQTSFWTIVPLQKKRDECSARSASPLGPRAYGMRAFPESF
ncbi:hypothetical protein TcBrA4_0067010 [Trypanosoma cruzi]|nr:hypothetical protein TcBrA4_0067010 [Trypanosoma cruzi]